MEISLASRVSFESKRIVISLIVLFHFIDTEEIRQIIDKNKRIKDRTVWKPDEIH